MLGQRRAYGPPGWPSGEGVGLKIQWAHARVGSNPTSGRSLLFLSVQSPHPSLQNISSEQGWEIWALCPGTQGHSVPQCEDPGGTEPPYLAG